MARMFGWAVLAIVVVFCGVFVLEIVGAECRPPQPLSFGTVQWDYETGFTVGSVRRMRKLTIGGATYAARGEFYLIDARVLCPFGERYHWADGSVLVVSYAGSGSRNWHSDLAHGQPGNLVEDRGPFIDRVPGGEFHVDESVQRALDRQTGARVRDMKF